MSATLDWGWQQTLDGKEIPHREVVAPKMFGPTQRAVLRLLAIQPGMTSTELDSAIPGGARAVRRLRRRRYVEKHFGLWFVARGPFE